MNFKELFDDRVQNLREQIRECVTIAESLKDDPIVCDTALAMCHLDSRVDALEAIDFDDRPPELLTLEEKGFYRLVCILRNRFRSQCELRQLAMDKENSTPDQEGSNHE